MALDFIATKTKKEINRDSPFFALSESLHDELFENAKPIQKYPILKKFIDYYADSVILYGEIPPLIAELNLIKRESNHALPELAEFIQFLNIMYDNGLNLYIYCD